MSHQLSTIKGFFKKITVGENSYDELSKQPILDADAKLTLFKDVTSIAASALENYAKSISKNTNAIPVEKLEECIEQFIKYEQKAPEALEQSKDILLNFVIDRSIYAQSQINEGIGDLSRNLDKFVLRPLTDYQKDVSTVKETRRELKDSYTKMDSCKASLEKAKKELENNKKQLEISRMSNADPKKQNDALKTLNATEEKIVRCDKELDDARLSVNERYDKYTEGLYKKVSEEVDLANYFLEYLKLQHNFHSQICQTLESIIPEIKNTINNYPKKPVFGQSIEEHLGSKQTSNVVSPVIHSLIKAMIEQNVFNEEGVFRIAGSKAKMNRLISSINAGYLDHIDFSEYDVHCLASVLKQYLRDLPDSIMCNNLCDDWVNALNSHPANKLDAFKYVIKKLPKANYENLKYIVKFLSGIIENSEQNKMTANNVGICFGVSFFNTNISDTNKGIDMSTATSAFDYILTNYNDLFTDLNTKNESSIQKPTLQYSQTFANRHTESTVKSNENNQFQYSNRYSVMLPPERKYTDYNPFQESNTPQPNIASRHIKKSSLDFKSEDLNKSPSPSPDVSTTSSPRVRKKIAPPPPPPAPAPQSSTVSQTPVVPPVPPAPISPKTNEKEITLVQSNSLSDLFPKIMTQTNEPKTTSNGQNAYKTPIKSDNLPILEKPPQPPPIRPPPVIGFNIAALINTTNEQINPVIQESPTSTLQRPPKPALPRKPPSLPVQQIDTDNIDTNNSQNTKLTTEVTSL